MLRENKNQGKTPIAFHFATPSNIENAGAPPAQPKPTNDVNTQWFASSGRDEGMPLIFRAKAESEGLVRTVKNTDDANGV